MIEPTESESPSDLDRFCGAIRAIERGTADRPFPRELAVFPTADTRMDKYWPPVARVDNTHRERHLVRACPPLEVY